MDFSSGRRSRQMRPFMSGGWPESAAMFVCFLQFSLIFSRFSSVSLSVSTRVLLADVQQRLCIISPARRLSAIRQSFSSPPPHPRLLRLRLSAFSRLQSVAVCALLFSLTIRNSSLICVVVQWIVSIRTPSPNGTRNNFLWFGFVPWRRSVCGHPRGCRTLTSASPSFYSKFPGAASGRLHPPAAVPSSFLEGRRFSKPKIVWLLLSMTDARARASMCVTEPVAFHWTFVDQRPTCCVREWMRLLTRPISDTVVFVNSRREW